MNTTMISSVLSSFLLFNTTVAFAGFGNGGGNATKIQGVPISASTPSTGNCLVYSSGSWAPATCVDPSSNLTISSSITFGSSGVSINVIGSGGNLEAGGGDRIISWSDSDAGMQRGVPWLSYSDNASDLGEPSNRWKSLNVGTNPSSIAGTLALPNITTGANANFVCAASDGTLLVQSTACTISSRRFKENIRELDGEEALREINSLRPVEFNMLPPTVPLRPNIDQWNYYRTQVGLIAEDVADVDKRLAVFEKDGVTPKSYRQEAIISMLIKAIQEQQKEIARSRPQ